LVVENARALNPKLNKEIKLDFAVIDNSKPSERYTFSYTLPVVTVAGPPEEKAGGIELSHPIVEVPFEYRNTEPLTHVYELTGDGIKTVELVLLSTEGIGQCPPTQLKNLLGDANGDFTNDENGLKSFCEWESDKAGFTLIPDSESDSSRKVRLQPTSGPVEKSYGETDFDVFFKVAKTDGVEAYLSLTVRYLDACTRPCAQDATCTAQMRSPCAGNEACMLCDLGIAGDADDLIMCATSNTDGYECVSAGQGEVDVLLDILEDAKVKAEAVETEIKDLKCDTPNDDTAQRCEELQESLATLENEIDDTEMELLEKQAVIGIVDKDLVKEKTKATEAALADAEAELNGMSCTSDPAPDSKCAQLNQEVEDLSAKLDALKVASLSPNPVNEADESSGGAGIIVGVIVGVLLLLIVVVAIVLWRNNEKKRDDIADKMRVYEDGGAVMNPGYRQPNEATFVAGQANPLYDWYHPLMSRPETDAHLQSQSEGGFVVRDSQSTPGWHMLCVKRQTNVLHEKIRLTEAGQYELLATDVDQTQPTFATIPILVEHYTVQRPGMPYVLKLQNAIFGEGGQIEGMGNPMYGMGAAPNLSATYDDIQSPA
jgi:hypothetical protein